MFPFSPYSWFKKIICDPNVGTEALYSRPTGTAVVIT